MEIINALEWRYATKKFDPDKKITPETLHHLKKGTQLAASSFGLQPYRVIIVEDAEIRRQLQVVSWNQKQIVDASHVFVFCHQHEVGSDDVALFFAKKAAVNGLDPVTFQGAVSFVSSKLKEKSKVEMTTWTAHQTYLAVGTLLATAAALRVDTCPMEGFDATAYDQILDLSTQGLQAAVVVALGYRSNTDPNALSKKTRKEIDTLFRVL